MPSRLSAAAALLIEAGWLAAVVAVPAFFDPHTVRNFDADKILLLRSLSIVMVAAMLVWIFENRRPVDRSALAQVSRSPVFVLTGLLTAAYCVSTIFSLAPRTSLLGGYFRVQGTYTWLAYVTIFAAIAMLAQRRNQVDRLVGAFVFAAVPPAIYGVIQYLGRDPIEWAVTADYGARIIGTAGNPIFLSAFMVMVVPVTLARLIERCAPRFAHEVDRTARSRVSRVLPVAIYLVVLVLQMMVIVYSRSRGPLIGLGAGLIVMGLVCASWLRARWMAPVGAGLALLCVAGIIALAFPADRPSPWSAGGTVKVRLLIWQGAAALLAAEPARIVVGYGPEMFGRAYAPFHSPEIGDHERNDSIPDRAHNATLDALIETGIGGCLAQLALFMAIFSSIMRRLDLVATVRQSRFLVGAMVGGGIAGSALPYLFEGGFRLSALGGAGGIVGGLIAYLIACVVRPASPSPARVMPHSFVLAGLLAGAVAHFVETQVGIATAATRLYIAAFAGLAVAIGVHGRRDSEDARGAAGVEVWLAASIVALALVLLTYQFSLPSVRPGAPGFVLLWLYAGAWLAGFLLFAVDGRVASGSGNFREVLEYAVISIGLWLPFCAIHLWWIDWRPAGDQAGMDVVRQIAAHVGHTVSTLYLFIFVMVTVPAVVAWRRHSSAKSSGLRAAVFYGLYLALMSGAVSVVVTTNLSGARADAIARLGATFEREHRLSEAGVFYEEAWRLRPAEDVYADSLARVRSQR